MDRDPTVDAVVEPEVPLVCPPPFGIFLLRWSPNQDNQLSIRLAVVFNPFLKGFSRVLHPLAACSMMTLWMGTSSLLMTIETFAPFPETASQMTPRGSQ